MSLDPNTAFAVPPELLGGSTEPGTDRTDSEGIVLTHAKYRRADENTVLDTSSEWVVYSAEQRERALTSHARLQNAIADEVESRGLVPWSPSSTGPQFDLGFVVNDAMVVIEVKSCTLENVEIQSRLGLGQVLRYAHRLRAAHDRVIAVLATELPLFRDWLDLLAGLDVHVIHENQIPAGLDALLEAVRTTAR